MLLIPVYAAVHVSLPVSVLRVGCLLFIVRMTVMPSLEY